MQNARLICASLFAVAAMPAHAADAKFGMTSEYTHFSGGFGSLRETGGETTLEFGRTKLIAGVTNGLRKVDGDKYSSVRFSGTVYHDWTDRFYSRTSISAASNQPVFARREVAQDFSYKLTRKAIVTVGGKHSQYYGGQDVLSWSAGGTYYFGGGLVSYRFSSYDSKGLKSSYGHTLSARIKDPRGSGSTQLWLGAGTALHDGDLLPIAETGKFRSVTLQRVQPLTKNIALRAGAGRTWYESAGNKYAGTTGTIGLTFTP
jgi:YaiO family outer membrane protein